MQETDIEKALTHAASALVAAYNIDGGKLACAVGYQERMEWAQMCKDYVPSKHDVELVARFITAHRRGKFGSTAAEIPQSPQRALAGFRELLLRAEAKAFQMRQDKAGVRCEAAPTQPWEEPDYVPADKDDFEALRAWRHQKIGGGK